MSQWLGRMLVMMPEKSIETGRKIGRRQLGSLGRDGDKGVFLVYQGPEIEMKAWFLFRSAAQENP